MPIILRRRPINPIEEANRRTARDSRSKAQKQAAADKQQEFEDFAAACRTDNPGAKTRAGVMYAAYLRWRKGKIYPQPTMSLQKFGLLVKSKWSTTGDEKKPRERNYSARDRHRSARAAYNHGAVFYFGVRPPELSNLEGDQATDPSDPK
jgi:hypothetical protein